MFTVVILLLTIAGAGYWLGHYIGARRTRRKYVNED